MRFAFAGGGEGVLRTVLTVVGIGLATALLLGAASITNMIEARDERVDAQAVGWENPESRSDSTILVGHQYTSFRGVTVAGDVIQPEGDQAVPPPGLSEFPEPGEIYVSQALWDLMQTEEYELLEPRLAAYDVAGVIGAEGIISPADLRYYLGSDSLSTGGEDPATRIDGFGIEPEPSTMDSVLVILMLVAITVLLVPVALFIGVAARFGGERRDRRLAALRLIGSDTRSVRWITAGEAAAGALAGLALGAILFLIGRHLVEGMRLLDVGVYTADIVPDVVPTLFVIVGVLAVAVGSTLFSMRRLSIEPLAVVRSDEGRPRRAWWRLVPLVLGTAMLGFLMMIGKTGFAVGMHVMVVGIVLFLFGLTAVLPWAVEVVVRRLRGGPVSWQLGVRRLQLSAGGTGRAVNVVAVAVAGGIALLTVFGGVEEGYVSMSSDTNGGQLRVTADSGDPGNTMDDLRVDLDGVDGAEIIGEYSSLLLTQADDEEMEQIVETAVGDCEDILVVRETVQDCRDGDVVIIGSPQQDMLVPQPGETWDLVARGPSATRVAWDVPETVKTAQAPSDYAGGRYGWGFVLITPGALADHGFLESDVFRSGYTFDLTLDEDKPDVVEHVLNLTDVPGSVWQSQIMETRHVDDRFAGLRTGIFVGVAASMLLIGLSLLVSTVEQLQDRRRLMSALVAFGTRRRSLCLSVLWQTLIPVAIGMVLALLMGSGLALLLTRTAGLWVPLPWGDIAVVVACGMAMVLLVTALSMPPLWRMMRPTGLRTE